MNRNENQNTNNRSVPVMGELGFASILTLIFIILKLTGTIDWSWIWVLSPFWISWILAIVLITLTLIVIIVKEKIDNRIAMKTYKERKK